MTWPRHAAGGHDIPQAKGLMMKKGTMVDAKLMAAPSSTKNAEGQRDPEMKLAKKGNQWYFCMKAYIGVDAGCGLVHSAWAQRPASTT